MAIAPYSFNAPMYRPRALFLQRFAEVVLEVAAGVVAGWLGSKLRDTVASTEISEQSSC